ncbi:MAG TPA: hypothetical protein VFE78_37175 [Gemmataceae bacterium]|jgi:hypothetical protein|nr:hypothetical protein [Gemmataceae bacterium]
MRPESVNVGCRLAGEFTDAETGAAGRAGSHESTRHAAVYEFIDDGAQPGATIVADLVEGETAWVAPRDMFCDAQGLLWFSKQAAVRAGPDEEHPVRVTRRADTLYVEAMTLGGGPPAGENGPPSPADRLPVVLE